MSLKDERIKAGLNQAEVAKICGVRQAAYSHYETGRRSPKLKSVEKLACFYGITVDELLKDNDDKGKIGKTAG